MGERKRQEVHIKGPSPLTYGAPGWCPLRTAALGSASGLERKVFQCHGYCQEYQGFWVKIGRAHWARRPPTSLQPWPTCAYAQRHVEGHSQEHPTGLETRNVGKPMLPVWRGAGRAAPVGTRHSRPPSAGDAHVPCCGLTSCWPWQGLVHVLQVLPIVWKCPGDPDLPWGDDISCL